MDEAKTKTNILQKFKRLPKSKKIQLSIAAILSLLLIILIPVYAWFNYQREIARIERIQSPDMLYITAANREDKINIDMNNIDTDATWNSTSNEKASYQYFVFAVAGRYVTNYNLQLAHTKNNNFTYEIFEADASNTNPGGIEGKDYVIYEPDDNRIPSELSEVLTHDGIDTNKNIYYSIKKDDSTPTSKDISLNKGQNYTITVTPAVVADPEQGIEAVPAVTKTYSYNGEYVNVDSNLNGKPGYNTLADDDSYKSKTYNYGNVDEHSVPLYWQCTGIPVEDTNNARDPFYHEYILKVSWDTANLGALVSKDTDIVYITVSVK